MSKWTNSPEELLAIEGLEIEPPAPKMSKKETIKTVVEVVPALLMPVIILGGIYSGIFTATEAAAVSIVYGILVSTLIYHELKLKDIPAIAIDSAKTAGRILVIVGFAGFFGRLLTLLQIPSQVTTAVLGVSDSNIVIMLLILFALAFFLFCWLFLCHIQKITGFQQANFQVKHLVKITRYSIITCKLFHTSSLIWERGQDIMVMPSPCGLGFSSVSVSFPTAFRHGAIFMRW